MTAKKRSAHAALHVVVMALAAFDETEIFGLAPSSVMTTSSRQMPRRVLRGNLLILVVVCYMYYVVSSTLLVITGLSLQAKG